MSTKKRIQLTFVFLLIMFVSLTFVSAITGSMGNAKMILYPEVNGWTNTIIDKTILTRNVNDVPINITLELSEEAKDFIELIDENYVLQPGEERKAQFKVKVKKEKRYDGRINVFFSTIDEKGPGVVLSSTIIVIAKKDQEYQEINDEENEDDEESLITGDVIGNENDKSDKGTVFFSISTLTLLAILIFLIYYNKRQLKLKKKKSKKKEKKDEK